MTAITEENAKAVAAIMMTETADFIEEKAGNYKADDNGIAAVMMMMFAGGVAASTGRTDEENRFLGRAAMTLAKEQLGIA